MSDNFYKNKYLKYKFKYNQLVQLKGGAAANSHEIPSIWVIYMNKKDDTPDKTKKFRIRETEESKQLIMQLNTFNDNNSRQVLTDYSISDKDKKDKVLYLRKNKKLSNHIYFGSELDDDEQLIIRCHFKKISQKEYDEENFNEALSGTISNIRRVKQLTSVATPVATTPVATTSVSTSVSEQVSAAAAATVHDDTPYKWVVYLPDSKDRYKIDKTKKYRLIYDNPIRIELIQKLDSILSAKNTSDIYSDFVLKSDDTVDTYFQKRGKEPNTWIVFGNYNPNPKDELDKYEFIPKCHFVRISNEQFILEQFNDSPGAIIFRRSAKSAALVSAAAADTKEVISIPRYNQMVSYKENYMEHLDLRYTNFRKIKNISRSIYENTKNYNKIFVLGHGSTTGSTFILPKYINLVTFTPVDVSLKTLSNKYEAHKSSIESDVVNFYNKRKTIFDNDDKTDNMTLDGIKFRELQKSVDPSIYIKNHTYNEKKGYTRVNEIGLDFDCPTILCRITALNSITGQKIDIPNVDLIKYMEIYHGEKQIKQILLSDFIPIVLGFRNMEELNVYLESENSQGKPPKYYTFFILACRNYVIEEKDRDSTNLPPLELSRQLSNSNEAIISDE